MKTATLKDKVTEKFVTYLVAHPDHAMKLHQVTEKVKAWLR